MGCLPDRLASVFAAAWNSVGSCTSTWLPTPGVANASRMRSSPIAALKDFSNSLISIVASFLAFSRVRIFCPHRRGTSAGPQPKFLAYPYVNTPISPHQRVFSDVSWMACRADQRNWQVLIVAMGASAAMLLRQDAEHKDSSEDSLVSTGFHLRVRSWLLMCYVLSQATITRSNMIKTMSIRTKACSYYCSD